ncbi:MAG: DNA cytosine methyltransferase, partial [Candidatus Kapaibacterium sp.]
MALTFGSLFSGIGGFDLGFERAGMECLWQCEIEPNARKVLKNHWPDVKLYEDVTKIKIKELARVDVICGGFPCQDLSIAGKRKGLAGERSGLWHEFHRILKGVRPAWCVIENVPGLLSSDEGRDFSIILSGLVELGYCISWRVCDAQYHGLAQRRERVFIVGSLGNGRSAEVLFDSESGIGNPAPSRKTRKENTDGIRNGIAGTLGSHTTGGWGGQDIDGIGAWIPELSHTLTDSTKGGSNDLNRLGALIP